MTTTPKALTEFTTLPEYLSAAETGARGELSMAAMERRIIVSATQHADLLGLGYDELLHNGNAWVLSRMSIEMDRMPRTHDTFSISTWIESYNRHLSDRVAAVVDSEGRAMGYARSLWACINIESRRPASLVLAPDLMLARECPMKPAPRLKPVAEAECTLPYSFTYSDIDFNRHVNSARYVELIDNCFPLEFHDSHRLRRLDVAYIREAAYGASVTVRLARDPSDPLRFMVDIDDSAGGTTHCRAALQFEECPSSGFMAHIKS